MNLYAALVEGNDICCTKCRCLYTYVSGPVCNFTYSQEGPSQEASENEKDF